MMEFTVEREDCKLFCVKEGQGPVLLLLHGVACDSSYYKEAMDYLSGKYTVVSYDRRGCTRSIVEEGADFSVETQAEDAKAVLDFLKCDSALVAGCSAGGLIALELAQAYPERVSKLFLHEPAIAASDRDRGDMLQLLDDLQQATNKKSTAKALLIFVDALGGLDPEASSKSLDQQRQDWINLQLFLEKELQDFLSYRDRRPDSIHLQMPCVVAVGEQDKNGLFSKAGAGNAEYLNCPLISAPGYHNLASDSPKEFAEMLQSAINNM